jgi:tRNA (guanine-N(7)-)-methyltransferase subunit TRM82
MGASNMPNQASSQLLTHLRILLRFQKDLLSIDNFPAILEVRSLHIAKQEEVLASVLAALKVSMHKMLVKKHYSEERREQRRLFYYFFSFLN